MAAAGHVLDTVPPRAAGRPRPVGLLTLVGGTEPRLAEAERLVAENRHEQALRRLDALRPEIARSPELLLRHRLAEAWARMYLGELDRAGELLDQADGLVGVSAHDRVQRADLLYRRGCLTLLAGDVAEATSLFTRALETNERAGIPSRSLAARIHEWRSRCHQRQRSLDAARRDAERALELATETGDDEVQARALVQSSLVAERQRQWHLARCYAEQALDVCSRRGDLLGTARIHNNLGGILFLLGDVEGAERHLRRAAERALEIGSDADAAQATSSLAQVYLRSDRPAAARELACGAADVLAGRQDFRHELGNAELVAARAHAAEGDVEEAARWLERAEATFEGLGATAELAAVLVARADLERATGCLDEAADLYRRAAEALQDFHF